MPVISASPTQRARRLVLRYNELDVFGVFVSPIAPMLLAAWLILLPLRRLAVRHGLTRRVWHPALADLAVLVILLSLIIIAVGRLR